MDAPRPPRPPTADGAAVVKLVVGGPYAAGKTTLVTTVAERALVTTEVATTSAGESARKASTTVGMDFGILRVTDGPRPVELHVVGTPGQERFAEVREILAEGADAFLLVVDASAPETFAAAREHHALLSRAGAPGVLVVNRATEGSVAEVEAALGDLGCPVVPCDVRQLAEVKVPLVAALVGLRDRVAAVASGGA